MDSSLSCAGWTLNDWRTAYTEGSLRPKQVIDWVLGFDSGDPAWIYIASKADLERQLEELEARRAAHQGPMELPLFGVPFAIKDNIDAIGWPTTAACPAYRRVAEADAEVVRLLREAGAILVGKTNLDQFATGLVGTRSPYGTVPSAFDATFIGGGSSSGSASVVTRGLVPFALGTDTAGSGRVPAALQNVVGYKPTRGRFSTRGVVPACRTLDCVSVFALTVDDAQTVARLIDVYDPEDTYARRPPVATPRLISSTPRLGVPIPLEFFGDQQARVAFEQTLSQIEALGVQTVPVDFTPFRELAELLYASPYVVERYLVAREVFEHNPSSLDPTVRRILEAAPEMSAMAAFETEYRRAALARAIDRALSKVDALIVPTTPTTYRISEVAADPLGTNAHLGTYTNCPNLADLSGLAVPGPFREDGLPAGITLLGRAHHEQVLCELGRRFEAQFALPLGHTGRSPTSNSTSIPAVVGLPEAAGKDTVVLAVVGAHLRGMPLHSELTEHQARYLEEVRTSARYELYVLSGGQIKKPALRRIAQGTHISLELYELPCSEFGVFVANVPPPLGIGTVELEDGRWVKGFICEPWGFDEAENISHFGGFRAYVASLDS